MIVSRRGLVLLPCRYLNKFFIIMNANVYLSNTDNVISLYCTFNDR